MSSSLIRGGYSARDGTTGYDAGKAAVLKRLLPLQKLKQELDRKLYAAKVDLSFLNIDDSLAIEIRRFLEGNRNVTSLNLSGNLLSSVGALDVIMGVRLAPNLEKLDMSHNLLGEWNGMQSKACFEEFFRRLHSNSSVLDLNLRGNRMKPFQAMYIGDMIKVNNWMTAVDLSHNEFVSLGAHHIWDAMKYNNSLCDFQLSNTGVPSDVLLDIAEKLRINKAAQIFAKRDVSAFSFSSPRTPDKRPVSSAATVSTRFTPSPLTRSAATYSPTPTKTNTRNLIEAHSQNVGVSLVTPSTGSYLFDNSVMDIGDVRDPYWSEILNKHDYMTEVDFSNRCVDDRAALEIAIWLENNKFCRDLNLAGNRITGKGAAYLGRALQTNKTLVGLEISDNPLGTLFGFMEFAKALSENDMIQALLMRNCDLGGFHAHCIKDMLGMNRSITHIDLCHNQFGLLGGELLRAGVEKNLKVISCQLSGCDVEHEQLIGIAQHLHENSKDAERRKKR